MIDLELENKVVIITGGSGGIGSACGREFLRQGAFVSIVDIDKKSGMLLEEELLVEYPGRARFFECDLTNIDSTCSVVDSTIAVFGQIDCIICNAAIFHANSLKNWDEDDLEQLRRHFEVGILGHMNMVRHAWADCPGSRGGSVITIGSTAGRFAEPKVMAYLPIKAALIEGVKQFAFEMADAGGWAVCVSPGHTFTREHAKRVKKTGQTKKEYEMTAGNIQNTLLKRFLEPEEIAVWVAIAASHYGRLMTGTEILVDAGIAAGGFNGAYVIPNTELS